MTKKKCAQIKEWLNGNVRGRTPQPDWPHPDCKLCAILKLYALLAAPPKYSIIEGAGRDILYLCDIADLRADVTEAQIRDLASLGIRHDSDTESLAMFV